MHPFQLSYCTNKFIRNGETHNFKYKSQEFIAESTLALTFTCTSLYSLFLVLKICTIKTNFIECSPMIESLFSNIKNNCKKKKKNWTQFQLFQCTNYYTKNSFLLAQFLNFLLLHFLCRFRSNSS